MPPKSRLFQLFHQKSSVSKSRFLSNILFFVLLYSISERHVAIRLIFFFRQISNRYSKFCCSAKRCKSSINISLGFQNFSCMGKMKDSISISVDLGIMRSYFLIFSKLRRPFWFFRQEVGLISVHFFHLSGNLEPFHLQVLQNSIH